VSDCEPTLQAEDKARIQASPRPALPLVSVLVPSYNHATYITQCVESIVKQTYGLVELIVIDDGSSDGSVEILKELCERYDFRFVVQENVGIARTLNRGIGIAKGKYICICASDDYWAPNKVEHQVLLMENDPNMVMCFTGYFGVDSNSNIILDRKVVKNAGRKLDFEHVLMYADLPPASIMMRSDELRRIGGFDPGLHVEDFDVWLGLLKNGGYAVVSEKKLAFYRMHEKNFIVGNLELVKDEHFYTVKKYLPFSRRRLRVVAEWSLRNAVMLASVNRKKSFMYLKRGLWRLWDMRIYKTLWKYLVR